MDALRRDLEASRAALATAHFQLSAARGDLHGPPTDPAAHATLPKPGPAQSHTALLVHLAATGVAGQASEHVYTVQCMWDSVWERERNLDDFEDQVLRGERRQLNYEHARWVDEVLRGERRQLNYEHARWVDEARRIDEELRATARERELGEMVRRREQAVLAREMAIAEAPADRAALGVWSWVVSCLREGEVGDEEAERGRLRWVRALLARERGLDEREARLDDLMDLAASLRKREREVEEREKAVKRQEKLVTMQEKLVKEREELVKQQEELVKQQEELVLRGLD